MSIVPMEYECGLLKSHIHEFLASPSEVNFMALLRHCNSDDEQSALVDLLYEVHRESQNAASHFRMIRACFVAGRYIEVVYFSEKYLENHPKSLEVLRPFCMSCIEAGYINMASGLIQEIENMGDNPALVLTLKIAFDLRINRLKTAYLTAIDLAVQKDCNETGYVAIVDLATRLYEPDLLLFALASAHGKGVTFELSKRKQSQVKGMLVKKMLELLDAMRGLNA